MRDLNYLRNWKQCPNCDLSGAILTRRDFWEDLRSYLRGANLSGANLTEANISYSSSTSRPYESNLSKYEIFNLQTNLTEGFD